MEIELKDLIEKIKDEGVNEAEKKAGEIISGAEEKAGSIIKEAEQKQQQIIDKANKEAKRVEANAHESIKHAARDVLLALRENITSLFDRVMKKDIADNLSADTMKEMLLKLTENFRKDGVTQVDIMLSEKDKKDLENIFLTALKKEMAKGVELKGAPGIDHGFRIGEKDGTSYYDFTDDSIEEAFKTYLNKKLTDILSPKAGNDE